MSYFPEQVTVDPAKTILIGDMDTPALSAGAEVQNLRYDRIDRFTSVTRAVATVFARRGDDFVRIATSLKKQDGSRALGTSLGQGASRVRSLLQGESYSGKATLFGKDYMTRYVPIKGVRGSVIGVSSSASTSPITSAPSRTTSARCRSERPATSSSWTPRKATPTGSSSSTPSGRGRTSSTRRTTPAASSSGRCSRRRKAISSSRG